MTPSGKREEPIWGLEAIATALGVSERTLKRLLRRPAGERPPLRHGHRGYYAFASRLQAWVDVEDIDAGLHLEILALRKNAAGTSRSSSAEDRDERAAA